MYWIGVNVLNDGVELVLENVFFRKKKFEDTKPVRRSSKSKNDMQYNGGGGGGGRKKGKQKTGQKYKQ